MLTNGSAEDTRRGTAYADVLCIRLTHVMSIHVPLFSTIEHSRTHLRAVMWPVRRPVGDLVRAATDAADISGGPLLAVIARYAVLALAVIIALNQIGVGAASVQVLFASVMFGLTLALALAFGLGGRETAKDIVESWYTSTRRRRTISAEETGRAAPSRTREDARTRPSAQEPVS
ncbi:MAG: hypothetical protein ACXWPI_10030 [Ktedonobacterales bacterium]